MNKENEPKDKPQSKKNANEEKIKFGIKFKLSIFVILLIILVVTIISSILTTSISNRQEKQMAEELSRNMHLSIDYLSTTAREAIISLDDLLLLNIVQKVAKFPDVGYVIITDPRNHILSHSSDIEKTGVKLEDPTSENALKSKKTLIQPKFDPHNISPRYDISMPINFRGKKVGIARIGYTSDRIFKDIKNVKGNILLTSLFVIIGTIALGIVGSIALASYTTKPVKTLVEGIRVFGQGNLDHTISISNKDEFGYLSKEFNKMAVYLKKYQNLLVEREVEKNLLDIAKGIQKSLVPQQDLKMPGVTVAGYSKTVFGVGGDYYDFFKIGKDKVGVIICDVFGKGIPAALVMVTIRTLLHTYKEGILDSTADIANAINKRITMDFHGEQYATFFFLILNYKTGRMICTNGGHAPLLIYRRKDNKFLCNEFGEIPIGMAEENQYTNHNIALEKGDFIILNTDGITEAENTTNEQLTEERLRKILYKYKDLDATKIVKSVISDVGKFTAGASQHDDMTLIIVEYK
ncbi:MAG: SpoIIE family protein phosphatase [Spirochaetes bacterium]|nr:SpoIIE family protein phosphatase [Spirochaetota bacterium]